MKTRIPYLILSLLIAVTLVFGMRASSVAAADSVELFISLNMPGQRDNIVQKDSSLFTINYALEYLITTTTTTPGPVVGYIEFVMPDGSVTTLEIDADNRLVRDYEITSEDGLFKVNFQAGTQLTTDSGELPSRIVVTKILDDNTSGNAIRVYEVSVFNGNGSLIHVDFNPPVLLTLRYSPDELPDGATGTYIAYYNEDIETWTKLEPPAGYSPQPGEVAVLMHHLSIYGIFADFTPLPTSEVLGIAATLFWIIIAALMVLLLLVLLLFIIIRRRRKNTDTA